MQPIDLCILKLQPTDDVNRRSFVHGNIIIMHIAITLL